MTTHSEADTGQSAARARGLGPTMPRRLLARLEAGRITIVTPAGRRIEHRAAVPGPEATLVLHRWRAIRRLVLGGDLGFAESYFAGDWTTPDLTALIELGARNLASLDPAIVGTLPARLFNRIRHLMRANTKAGSRRNIAFHYDLGNEFYRLWLDEGMTYSSALFETPIQSLEDAQAAKIARIAALLELDRPGARVLEIGCGWGTLAAALASRGAYVTGLTLSTEQQRHARALLAGKGLAAAADIRLEDYRDTTGTFDRIVSIEMFEAVGEQYWPAYFEMLRDRLVPGGTAVLQVITIDESRFEGYRRGADFIQRYVFPGGMLPTKTLFAEHAARVGLNVASAESFGAGYALTLAEWKHRFTAAWPQVEALGFDLPFRRLWEYYLSYCEAGFRTGTIDVTLYALRK